MRRVTPHSSGSWLRRRPVVAAIVLTACAALIAVIGGRTWWASDARASDRIQGPQPAAITLTPTPGADPVVCPQGSTPYVNITFSRFAPGLTNGTSFRPGRYQILLTGQLANETTAAIVIDRIVPWTLHHQPWPGAHVRAPLRLAANSSGRLRISGTFRASARGQAIVGASLRWHWAAPRLRACGERGLIDDD
jgi:hypothetical protein